MNMYFSYLKSVITWLGEALFPSRCLICYRPGPYLCNRHHHFSPAPPSRVRYKYLDQVHAATKYKDVTSKKIINALKFTGIKPVIQIMYPEIISCVPDDVFWRDKTIIPVPLHWTRKLQRGFNQSIIIAKALKKYDATLVLSMDLKRVKKTKQQARLSKIERTKNLKNAFAWKGGTAAPQEVILIDDVVASGQTLEAAAKALKKAGSQKVYGVVFARGGN